MDGFDGLYANEQYANHAVLDSLRTKFHKLSNRKVESVGDIRDVAHRLFFRNETELIGAVESGFVAHNQGSPEPILVGRWRYDNAVAIRAGVNYCGLALIHPHKGWCFEIRTDVNDNGGGYFRELPAFHTGRSLKDMESSIP